MTKQNRLYSLLALLALVVVVAFGSAYYRPILSLAPSATLPSQTEWASAISTSTLKTLSGKITTVAKGSLTLEVTLPPNLGITTVTVGSSTPITKVTPKSPAEMAAAFKEFQRLQQEANGKPFDAPSASTIATLSFSDVKAGDSVLITLTPSSSKGNFTAESIEVMPAPPMPAVPSPAPTLPPTPAH
jgi:hypothetical protein